MFLYFYVFKNVSYKIIHYIYTYIYSDFLFVCCCLLLSEMMKEKAEQTLMKYDIGKNSYHIVFERQMNMIFRTKINDFN